MLPLVMKRSIFRDNGWFRGDAIVTSRVWCVLKSYAKATRGGLFIHLRLHQRTHFFLLLLVQRGAL